MEFILIKKDSLEWEYLWNWLANHPVNKDLEEPTIALNDGESWQYMGTFKQGDRILHSMRHRFHPILQRLIDISIQGSPDFNVSMIEPKTS